MELWTTPLRSDFLTDRYQVCARECTFNPVHVLQTIHLWQRTVKVYNPKTQIRNKKICRLENIICKLCYWHCLFLPDKYLLQWKISVVGASWRPEKSYDYQMIVPWVISSVSTYIIQELDIWLPSNCTLSFSFYWKCAQRFLQSSWIKVNVQNNCKGISNLT